MPGPGHSKLATKKDYILECHSRGVGTTEIAQSLENLFNIKTNKQNVDAFIRRQLKSHSEKLSSLQIQQIASEKVAQMLPDLSALLVKEVTKAIKIALERDTH
jgi:hypothetical protein